MMEIIYVVLAVIALFITVILLRAINFKPTQQLNIQKEDIFFDKKVVIENLCSLIRCKTVSNKDKSKEDKQEFVKLKNLITTLYPNFILNCEKIDVDDNGLLYKLKGKNSDLCVVLMSHYDVVPADAKNWIINPFSPEIIDNKLFGRGVIDTKLTLNAILYSMDLLLTEGFIPNNDIYFAFSGEEEVNGEFSKKVVDYFKNSEIKINFVLDEGGAVVNGVFPGVKQPCALVGIAEKGFANVSFTAVSNGGHASAPKINNPIKLLSKACLKVENKPFKMKMSLPCKYMFDNLARNSNFLYKIIFANLWCFGPIIDIFAKKKGGDFNASLRTTVAFTQLKASSSPNVLPTRAEMIANVRLNSNETLDSLIRDLKSKVKDDNVKIEIVEGYNPSTVSVIDDNYNLISNSINETFDNVIISPYLMVQCSDSRNYHQICSNVYKFSACDLTSEERKSIHANNESLRLEAIYRSIEFYIRLIKKL